MDITTWIRKELEKNIDNQYKEFHSSLVPDIGNMLGVRIPKLRELAKKAAKEDYKKYITNADVTIYEELMIWGMMLGYAKLTREEQQAKLKEFVPYINNWAICDCCCATYKFMKKNQEEWFLFLTSYLHRKEEYQVRFAVVCMLDFFINEAFIDEVLSCLKEVSCEKYYVKMAVAWALSVCYVKFPQKTETVLESKSLKEDVKKKTLQKIRESLRISKEEKERLKQKFQ